MEKWMMRINICGKYLYWTKEDYDKGIYQLKEKY